MKTKSFFRIAIFSLLIFSLGIALSFIFLTNKKENNVTAAKFSMDEQEATISAINKAMPAVVSILVYEDSANSGWVLKNGQLNSDNKELKGSGSGFLISADGLIVTNKHVVNSAVDVTKAEFKVVLNNKKKYYAQFIGKDPINDIAILKIFDKNLPYLELDNRKKPPIGLTVMAIGNVLGKYQNSVTKGIISGVGRSVEASDQQGNLETLDNVLQTDAEINLGNSGGPLIDLEAKVVGINVAVDKSGSSIGFAIPSNDVKNVIDSVRKIGRIVRPRLGVRYVMINQDIVEQLSLKRESGALIVTGDNGEIAIASGSPAEKIDLRKDDIIFEIDGIKIDQSNSLLNVLQNYKVGQKVGLKIDRGGKVIVKEAVLDEFKQ